MEKARTWQEEDLEDPDEEVSEDSDEEDQDLEANQAA